MSVVKLIIEVDIPNLSEEIKAQIKEKDLSANQVAFEAGMTPSNLYRILSEDNKGVPLETLKRIIKVIGLDLTLLTGDWIKYVPGYEDEDSQP